VLEIVILLDATRLMVVPSVWTMELLSLFMVLRLYVGCAFEGPFIVYA
jgi:hypothetical protein